MPESSASFSPPTAEQFAQHLAQHPPRLPSPWAAWGPLLAVAGVALLGMLLGGAVGMLMPWLAIGALFIYLAVRVRGGRDLEGRTNQAHELAMLRHHAPALRRAWTLLPRVSGHALLHARVVALMAQCLDRVKAHEAAIVGYDYLLEHLPDQHPGTVELRVRRTIAALCADHLSDGDDGLRRLRSSIDEHDGSTLAAEFRLAQLIQQVRTNHFADAIDEADHLLEQLRPLGVEAGYGHALLALCHHHHRTDDPQASQREARRWWDRARMLLPASAMVNRFPELSPLMEVGDHE